MIIKPVSVLIVSVILAFAGVGISQATDPFSKLIISGPAELGTGTSPSTKNLVDIVVNAGVYHTISTEITQFAADIEANGFRTVIETVSGGAPDDLRNEVKTWLVQGLVGVIGVGDLPVPLFKVADEPNIPVVQIFPCDLFYEDLDGEWIDSDGDGVFDVHQDGIGNRDPEIWFGKIDFSSLINLGNEVNFLKDYFARNHAWRSNWPTYMNSKRRALVYLDDAIYDIDYPDTCFSPKLKPIYDDNIDVIRTPMETTKTDYLERLQENYELVCLESHGSPSGQYFSEPDGTQQLVWLSPEEVLASKPIPYFYDLVGCSEFNYGTASLTLGNIGEAYLAGNGLVLWGVAKGGGGFQSDDLYKFLANGDTFGDAWYNAWYDNFQISNCATQDEFACRHSGDYGRVLMGDPTLWLQSSTADKCAATLSNDLSLHVPIAIYSGQPYSADFQWTGGTAVILNSVTPLSDPSSFNNCTPASVASDLSIHIPVVLYNNISYWIDLQYSHDLTFTLTGAGQRKN